MTVSRASRCDLTTSEHDRSVAEELSMDQKTEEQTRTNNSCASAWVRSETHVGSDVTTPGTGCTSQGSLAGSFAPFRRSFTARTPELRSLSKRIA